MMNFVVTRGKLIAFLVGGMLTSGCAQSHPNFDKLCEDNFAFEVHSDELWTQFIDAAAPHLLTPGKKGNVTMPSTGDFRAISHYSYACETRFERDPDGNLNVVDECPKDTPIFGFVTLVWPIEQSADGSNSEEVVFEPIVTFSNMAISESSNEGRMKDCFVKNTDEYVSRAYNKWKSE